MVDYKETIKASQDRLSHLRKTASEINLSMHKAAIGANGSATITCTIFLSNIIKAESSNIESVFFPAISTFSFFTLGMILGIVAIKITDKSVSDYNEIATIEYDNVRNLYSDAPRSYGYAQELSRTIHAIHRRGHTRGTHAKNALNASFGCFVFGSVMAIWLLTALLLAQNVPPSPN